MAHGELIMIGAYCTYVVQQIILIILLYLFTIPFTSFCLGCVGIIIERVLVKNLYGRPRLYWQHLVSV